MAPGLDKKLENTDKVFTTSYAKPEKIRSYIKTLQLENISKEKNDLALKGYYFEDSSDIVYHSLDLFYTKQKITQNIDIGIDGEIFAIKNNQEEYNGFRYALSLFWDHFHLRLGENRYDDFNEFVPYISYSNHYKRHSYILEYTHQNALFYTYSLCSYKKRIETDHFSVSDYIMFENKTDLWMNLQANIFSNSTTNYIAQYDWRFFHNTLGSTNTFQYHLALEGWYTTNTKQNGCFYSPKFADTTMLRIDPVYHFSKYLNINGKVGGGYSFEDNNFIYKTGLWFFGNPKENLSYNIGCLYSNTSKISSSKTNYSYQECVIDMGYKW